MKATTFAAAAAFLGSVSAEGWDGWTSKSSDPVEKDPATSTWSDWSKTPDPETSTWSDWSKKPDPETSTWSDWSKTPDPATSTWSAWETSKTPDPATTWSQWSTTSKSADPETKNTWAEWGSWSKTTTKSADPSTQSSWSDWNSWSKTTKSADPSTQTSWSDWNSWSATTSKPATVTSKDKTWGDWEDDKKITKGPKTITSVTTEWVTVTVYEDDAETWSVWDPTPQTATWGQWGDEKNKVVSSTVTKTATDAKWTDWNAAQCKLEVSYSYGQPIWAPSPTYTWADWEKKPAVKTSSASWSDWKAQTTKPADKATGTWSDWNSKTSAKPAVTSSAIWVDWEDDKSKGVIPEVNGWANFGSKVVSSAKAAATWGTWAKDKNGITANGNKFGMTWSPYKADSTCKDEATVASDIKKMAAKGFTSVRVYSTGCKTLEYVGKAARENKMKIILGVFISETGIAGAKSQVDDIVAWKQWDLVELIVVGNEAVFSKRCSAAELAGFITSSKASFKAVGYTGAVSTTDELSVWQSQGSAWCDAVDVVTANLYAFFNPDTTADQAGDFIQRQINDLQKVCPGKDVYVMESGWPSAGNCNGKACPSKENQATAIKSIQAAVGAKIVFFSFEDEAWKTSGEFNVEQHWGCGDVFA